MSTWIEARKRAFYSNVLRGTEGFACSRIFFSSIDRVPENPLTIDTEPIHEESVSSYLKTVATYSHCEDSYRCLPPCLILRVAHTGIYMYAS